MKVQKEADLFCGCGLRPKAQEATLSDDRFNVIVHHGGEVEAHEEAAEVEIGDASGLNSDVEVGENDQIKYELRR
ncbi:hypothetical protein DEO72_LG11g3940 [Vigna unguiculata]|uniref:Uncharacterized protein n=1 Tax=Vigna unguiculata TaxID=3917 RepID=A0A4D6NV97_VIGUN|nr:hypothetical protein DEO72_LG11g3940 [Vigna unguiculata]